MEKSCYVPRKVVRANLSKSIIRPSEVHLILVRRKCEMHVIPEVKDYATLVVCKNSLTNFSRVNNLTLVVNKYSDVILSKFKAVRFMLE